VGGLLCEPTDPTNLAGVIFFNNVGFLGMCGHGTIGLITTLAHMGKLTMPLNRIETPVGVVTTKVEEDGSVTVENVPSYRYRAAVSVDVHGYGKVTGDVAWGGNWFFLVGDHGMELKSTNIDALTECSWAIRHALESNGITGENGAEIDHIELFTPSPNSQANSRNFVLCPGGAYDRSPCGTGTSAKLACLSAAGQLKPGETWRQESVIGSVFEGRFTLAASHPTLSAQRIVPSITGTAFVTAEADLIVNSQDPFGMGIPQ
jgi:4-hydroxyproline epimerase